MSERMNVLYYALWIAHPVFLAGIAAVMLRRKLHRKFMFFFAYVITEILTFAVIFPSNVRHNYTAYFYLYWVTNAINIVLGFLVIHEVFSDVFRPFHTLRDLGTVLFKWAGLVMLLVAGVVSVSTNAADDMKPWMLAIITAQRCVRIIQCGMVLLLLFFARYLGVSKRQHSFGIALGFGSYAMVELVLIASFVGDHMDRLAMDLVNMAAYNLALLTWLGYVLAKSPVRETAVLLQPHRWEQSLSDIHYPLPANSLIPMFEGMVDRALSRTQEGMTPPASENDGASTSTARGSVVPMSPAELARRTERVGTKS